MWKQSPQVELRYSSRTSHLGAQLRTSLLRRCTVRRHWQSGANAVPTPEEVAGLLDVQAVHALNAEKRGDIGATN